MKKMKLHIIGILILLSGICACLTGDQKDHGSSSFNIKLVIPHKCEKYRHRIIEKCKNSLKGKMLYPGLNIKIVIYSYSSGIERFSINNGSSNGTIQQTKEKGHISVLLLIKPVNKAKRVHFIDIRGDDMDDLALQLGTHLSTLID